MDTLGLAPALDNIHRKEVVSERHLQLRAPERLKASVPHFRHLSEGVPEGKEIVMEGCDGERALGCLDNQRQGLIYSL